MRALVQASRGTGLTPTELNQSRYLDALIAFRPDTCLRMDGDGDGGDGGSGGQGGDGGGDGGSGGDGGAGGDQGGKGDQGKGDSGKGYPADTKVADMKPEEQAAYYKHQSQKHEERNKALLAVTGGKHGDALKAELEELGNLRKEKLTPSEKAIEDAKTAARAEAAKEFSSQLVAAKFEAALAHVAEDRREQLIEGIALEKFLTSDGKVDADKVKTHAAAIAPDKDTGNGGKRDFGQGNRGNGQNGKSGVAAGADMYASRRKSSTTS